MKYLPLLTVRLAHSYYSDGRCRDFIVTPDDATAKLLRNHRCVLRPRFDGLAVYVPLDPGAGSAKPFIAFTDDRALSFDLRLCNREFPLYTDYAALPNDHGFRLRAGKASSNAPFATIDIQGDFNHPTAPAAELNVSFNSQRLRWAYYLVTDQANGKEFSVIDGLGQITFQRNDPPPSDSVSVMLANQFPNATILRFLSNGAIPCQEVSTDKIELWLGENKIVERLPSPSYRNFFQLDPATGSQAADAIFQIVNYITNSTLMKG